MERAYNFTDCNSTILRTQKRIASELDGWLSAFAPYNDTVSLARN
jgi:hypothetical protein